MPSHRSSARRWSATARSLGRATLGSTGPAGASDRSATFARTHSPETRVNAVRLPRICAEFSSSTRAQGSRRVIALAVDENFDHQFLRALVRRVPALDFRTVQQAGLAGADDPAVLARAAREGRVLLTHDVKTVTKFAYERV